MTSPFPAPDQDQAPSGWLPTTPPRLVWLFSGHMMDAPERTPPRFPADKEAMAASRIAQALDAAQAGPDDLALSQAAAGGDILFLEACQARGVPCRVLLPFPSATFAAHSVLPAAHGPMWLTRYQAVLAHLDTPPRILQDELGPAPSAGEAFERCNVQLLENALHWGAERVRFICLWNGQAGDGPGGTQHMVETVQRQAGQVSWIDTRTL